VRKLDIPERYDYPVGYGDVYPVANYTPWSADERFQEVYRAIASATQVDVARCYELWTLLPQTDHLPGAVLEVGVWRGGTGALLAARARSDRETSAATSGDAGAAGSTVYLADTFRGVVKAGPKDDYYTGGEHADASREMVESLLQGLHLDNWRLLEGVFPDETAGDVSDDMIRFCHIDVDVYQSAKDTLEWVWPRIPVGGIVVYDDYGFYGCEGVTALGNEDRARTDRVMIHNLNGHGVLVKTLPGGVNIGQ
jgi:O-methyltransferase